MTRILSLLGILGISFSAVFVRLADVSPSTTAIFRAAYAVPALLIAWLFVMDRDDRTLRERAIAFAAGLCLAVDLFIWHHSIFYIGAGLSTVLANTQVVFVALLAWVIHGERPSSTALATIPVVFLGVGLISGLGRVDTYGSNPGAGVLTGVLTGLAYSSFLLVFRRANRRLAPTPGPLLDATVGALVGSILISPLDPRTSFLFSWPAHGWLIALALVAQVFGWLLIANALPRLPALDTSVLLLLQPMLTVFWGMLIFHEEMSALQWTGVGLVLAGVGILTVRGTMARETRARALDEA